VAIDRATRWVFSRICNSKTAANARRFLRDLERACQLRIRMVLTERAIDGAIGPSPMASGKEFTDRLFGLRKHAALPASPNSTGCAATIRHCRSDQWRDMAHHRPPP